MNMHFYLQEYEKGLEPIPRHDTYPFELFDSWGRDNGIHGSKSFTNVKQGGDMFALATKARGNGHIVGALGRDREGKLHNIDLDEIHTLVTGQTRSGKTNWLKALIFSLVHYNHPEYLRIVCVDGKYNSFAKFDKVCTVVNGFENSVKMVDQLYDLLQKRLSDRTDMSSSKHALKQAYRRRQRKLLVPYVIVIFDEYAYFMSKLTKETEHIKTYLDALGALGAGMGISMLLATQAPYREIVQGNLKNNFERRLTFQLGDEYHYRMTLGNRRKSDSEEHFLRRGDLLLRGQHMWERYRSLHCEDGAVDAAVKLWEKQGLNFNMLTL